MKLLIMLPEGQLHRLHVGPIKMSFREAPLTATALAAMVPAELNADIKVVDESVSPAPLNEHFDLVAISVMTGTSTRAYQLADHYRSRGIPVVLGGVHVTLLPDEAKQHADAIVIGFAEQEWPKLLRDFAAHKMLPLYQQAACGVDLNNIPNPRRDLQKKLGYAIPNTVWATRGCRQRCEFCSVVAANFGFHRRPIGQVIDEVRTIKAKRFAFNDVNLTDDVDYAKELCKALIPFKKSWGGLASTRVTNDDEMMDLLQKSGCNFLLLGFESVNPNSLTAINKRINNFKEYKNVINNLHRHKIVVQGCFIFGIDGDNKMTFQNTVEAINELKVDIPRYALYTPFPGTGAYATMEREGRLLHRRWEYYDTQHVVIQPDAMSPLELDEGFKWAVKETYKIKSIRQRLEGSGNRYYIGFVGNLAYRIYVKKLHADTNRFPADLNFDLLKHAKPGARSPLEQELVPAKGTI